MARKNTNTAPKPAAPKKTAAPKWAPLTEAEATEALRVARPAVSACLCGCGQMTKSRFAPGHDATHKERLKATVASGTPKAKLAATEALARFGW